MPDLFVARSETHFHPLASFCDHPNGVRFSTQQPDETILLFLRAHLVTNVPWIVTTIILAVIPYPIAILFSQIPGLITNVPNQFFVVLLLFYLLAVFAFAFINFLTWFYNIIIVTNKRIIDIDYSDIVYHDVAQTKMNLIEDVNYTQVGFIRSFFNYGDIFAQTAGGKENIEGLAVPQPARAVQIIADLIGKGGHSG